MELTNSFEFCLRYTSFDQNASELLKENIKKTWKDVSFSSVRLPIKKKRLTLLRSPHVNKKSRDQLEIRLYNGLIIFRDVMLSPQFLEQLYSFATPIVSLKCVVLKKKKK